MTDPRSGDSAQFRRILNRNLVLPLAMGLGSIVVFVGLLWHLIGLLNWVDHTHRAVAKGHELATLSADQESGLRGFLLSGDDSFLTPYLLGQAKFLAELEGAERMMADNPAQVDKLRRVAALAQRWTTFAETTIAMRRPSRRPRRDCTVKRSRSACVGWACQPSPPLMTLAFSSRATVYGAPEAPWRMTTMSAPSACKVRVVSTSVSPFSTLDPDAEIFTTSAERFLAASSKLTRVRVLAS